jgi:iron complex outermembrane receptor protein
MKRSSVGVAVIFAGAAFWGAQAKAQTENAEAAAPAEGGLAEVVVTAEKRVESEQKTPISMNVISAAEIAQKGITDFATLATNDTSVNFSSNGSEGYLTVRGVSSHDTTEIGDPAVPIVIDGFTTIRPYTLNTSLYDLQRIEVLRGPQGTLYGRNAEGGLVNVISQKPTKDFAAGGSAELGNFNTNNFTGYLNLPVFDNLQLRVSGSSRRHDGFRTITSADGVPEYKADDEDSHSLRVQANYTPFDNFDAWFLFQSTQLGGSGFASQNILFNPGPPCVTPTPYNPTCLQDISHDRPILGDPRRFPLYGQLSQDIDDKVYKWQFTYSGLPFGTTATYLGGYDNVQWHHSSPIPTLLGASIDTPTVFIQNEFPKTTNHELRFTSDTSGPVLWQAGLYYFEERSTNLNSYGQTNPGGPDAANLLSFFFPLVDTKSHAGFGQASYIINDENKITAGARYSRDTKSRNGTFNLDTFGIFGLDQHGESESSKTTYHVGYDWTPTNTNLVYAKFDTGYKPGGFTTCNPYDPESVKAFELGSKNRFDNNRIQVNLAAFYNKYENQQVSALSASCSSGTVVQNAGSSKIYGLEGSVDALVTEADKLDLGITVLHARFDDFLASPTNGAAALGQETVQASTSTDPVTGLPVTVYNNQLKGNMLPQAPNVTLALGYEHTWKLVGDNGLNFRVEGKYQSKQYFDSFNYNDSEQEGYATINAYFGYSTDKWRVNLFGRNLADKVYLVDAAEVTTGGAHTYRYGFGAPRTFGVHFEGNL